jgi:sugar lactone lactonase YvrE
MTATAVGRNRVECVVEASDLLGETPLWCDRSRRLWWVDIERRLHRSFDPATGVCEVFSHDCRFLGSQALTSDGAHLLAKDLDIHGRDETSATRLSANVERGADNRLNDGRVDARGRLWIGTMDNQLHRPNGSLYRVDSDGTVTRMLDDVIVTNGIAFSPDNRVLYFTDTRRYCSWQFDFDVDDGVITDRRMFADHRSTKDRPDGACVDVDGCVWSAFFSGGRVVRYRPNGTVDLVLTMPVSNPTCVCFGESDLKTLFVTSASKFLTSAQRAEEKQAGSVFAIRGIGQGLPEHRFVHSPKC